ncbi:hypothetical protein ACIBF1_44275 [Spirillospora sp. NPDC050679]
MCHALRRSGHPAAYAAAYPAALPPTPGSLAALIARACLPRLKRSSMSVEDLIDYWADPLMAPATGWARRQWSTR